MAQVHMTEAEVTKNFAAVLETIRQGAEVVVEQDRRPVAVIRRPKPSRSADTSMRKEGSPPPVEPVAPKSLLEVLESLGPIDEEFPDMSMKSLGQFNSDALLPGY